MQVNVIRGGDAAFNALVYPPPDQKLLSYLNDNIQNVIDTTANLGSSFIDNVKAMYNKYNSVDAINQAKMMLFTSGMHFSDNIIYPVRMDSFGSTNLIMQRYIMSEPEVSKLYKNNSCYGFQDTYLETEPGVYGVNRTDYRQVMDGMVEFVEDGYIVNHYAEIQDDSVLDIFDKLSILDTWANVQLLIANGIDPTNLDGDEL